jgi:hypothetical protein
VQDATIVQVVSGVDWPAIAAAIAGGVVGVAGIGATVWQARRSAEAGQLAARKQEIAAVTTAAMHLQDAVRLYRDVGSIRRTWIGGVATGLELVGPYFIDDTKPSLLATVVLGGRDVLKVGGLYDQMQIATGERYKQVVTPPLERLTAAAETVRVNQSGKLRVAAAKVLHQGSILAEKADASSKKEYQRAEGDFKRALTDFQNAS